MVTPPDEATNCVLIAPRVGWYPGQVHDRRGLNAIQIAARGCPAGVVRQSLLPDQRGLERLRIAAHACRLTRQGVAAEVICKEARS